MFDDDNPDSSSTTLKPNDPRNADFRRYRKNGEPTIAFRRLFAAYLMSIPPHQRAAIENRGLNPWDKYALASRLQRAMYYRIRQFDFESCDETNHVHLTLVLAGFSHTGEEVCVVAPVPPDHLVPYPYSAEFPPSKEAIELEQEFMRRTKEARQAAEGSGMPPGAAQDVYEAMVGTVLGGRMKANGKEEGWLAKYDDRGGKGDGH